MEVSDGSVKAAYERLHPRLWHALYAYSGDAELAADAEAEAFTQAIRRGSGIRDLDAWVWRTAFRVAGGMLAERRRVSLVAEPVEQPQEDATPALDLLAELADLSDQQRAVVVLRYVGGFAPIEIADLLHTTPGSVRVQLHRAHARLRVTMEDRDG